VRRERKLPARALLLGLADRAELTGHVRRPRPAAGAVSGDAGVEYDAAA
jgi:hypothetical protein